MNKERVVCFDIGGTNVKFGLLDKNGNIEHKDYFKTNINCGNEILTNMCKIIDFYKESNEVIGISISSPGFVNVDTGTIEDGTIIEGFIGLNAIEYFNSRYNLPVVIENDANCATIAEHKLGNGLGCNNLVCVTIGTGIGGGIIVNNQIYNGSRFMAGEFGFMFINNIEDKKPEEYIYSNYASTRALVEKATKSLGEDINGKEIFDRAKLGDEICNNELDCFYTNLAKGIYNLAYILNPDKILLGGAISQQEDIVENIKNKLDSFTPSFSKSLNQYVEIDRCKFLNDAGLIGSLYNFVNKYN